MASATPLKLASGKLKQFSATDTVPLANGGTNASLTASNGGIIYSTASGLAILTATATAGQMLRSGASAAPTWSTNTFPDTTPVSQILFATSANIIGGSTRFLYDGTNLNLINTATPVFARSLNIADNSAGGTIGVGYTQTSTTGFSNLFFAESSSLYCSFSRFNSATAGNYSGTSVAFANSLRILSGSGSDQTMMLLATPLIIQVGATSTNIGLRNDASGINITTSASLHTSASISGSVLQVRVDANAATISSVINNTSGTAGKSVFYVTNSSTIATHISLQSFSAAFTTDGMLAASSGALVSSQPMQIGTYSNNILSLWTNNNQRASINVGGGFIIQSGNKLWMKNTVSNTNYWSAVLVSGVLTWTDSGSTTLPTT